MARIDWNDTFSVNNDTIDKQHQTLVQLYNDLHESLLHGSIENAAATRVDTLNKLADYIDYHFSFEEELLKAVNFPDFDKHCQIHRVFSKQVKSFQQEIQNGEMMFTSSLIKLLRNWITDHILTMDKAYTDYLSS